MVCEVKASVHQRVAYILADEAAVTWITTGLYRAVQDDLDVHVRANSHIAGRRTVRMLGSRAGIRSKVYWMPEKSAWGLKFKGVMGDDKVYCNENGLSLTIPLPLSNQTYEYARDKAFHNACMTWNAVDKSGRKRIRTPELPLKKQMVPVLQSKAMSHNESEPHSEAASCDEDEVLGDSQHDI